MDTANNLWAEYNRTRSIEDRNALVEHYLPLVATTEDQYGSGCIGLIKAVEHYNAQRGPFPKFAQLCIYREVAAWERADHLLRRTHRRRYAAWFAANDGSPPPNSTVFLTDSCDQYSEYDHKPLARAVLSEMTPRMRLLAILRFWYRRDLKECADALGISRTYVSTLLRLMKGEANDQKHDLPDCVSFWSDRVRFMFRRCPATRNGGT